MFLKFGKFEINMPPGVAMVIAICLAMAIAAAFGVK